MKKTPLKIGSLVESRWHEFGAGTILEREEFAHVNRYRVCWHHHETKFGPHTTGKESWESGRDLVLVEECK